MSALDRFCKLILGDDNATAVLKSFEIDQNDVSLESLESIQNEILYLSGRQYRVLLPIVLDVFEKIGPKNIESVTLERIITLPQKQLQMQKFNDTTLISELRARNYFRAGWVAPALSSFSYYELSALVVAIDELALGMTYPIKEYFERDLCRLSQLVEMAKQK